MDKTEQRQLMTIGNYRKKIILFALPIFIGALFQQLYNTVDSLIVGNYLGPDALAAVGSTGVLTYLLIGFYVGFSNGAGVITAHFIGAGRDELTERSVHTSVAVGIVFGILMTAAGVLGTPFLLRLMGTPQNVFGQARLYLQVYFGGAFFIAMYNMLVGILQAAGDSRHPLIYLVISSLTNIVLDLLFVAGLGMGVEGAALATVLSEMLSVILCLIRLLRVKGPYRLNLRRIRFDRWCTGQILRQGFPAALQAVVIDLGNLLIQSYINSFGASAMAGIGAYTKVEGFCFLPVTAFSIAVTTFVSQNLGAGKTDRVKKGIRFSLLCSLLLIEAVGIAMFLFAPQLIGAFSRDPEVIAFGVGRARVCGFFYGLLGFSHVASAVMRGLEKPAMPAAIMLVCWCAVRVGAVLILGPILRSIALSYWLYPVTWTLSSICFIVLLKRALGGRLLDAGTAAV